MNPRKSSRELLALQTRGHDLKVGQRFVHYDTGGVYEVILVGFWEPAVELSVAYRSVDTGVIWIRPLSVFLERVNPADGGPAVARFAPLETQGC